MSDSVKLVECPRDAWQGLKSQIPAYIKTNYLKALISAGFKHIDAVSFVSPKAVPQMMDSEEVLRELDPPDTVGLAGPAQIRELFEAVHSKYDYLEIGLHLHSRPEQAGEKIQAAYDAGCRRFDSVLGGLGGCPFAQDALVGNIATEKVVDALRQREAELPALKSLDVLLRVTAEIGARYTASAAA